ncbi:MAG TPA: hypothetical protein VFE51_08495 [Verrucomicrobiae bacterium]|nr:hypothetical protein [Verrucomicrobiae bacterium]
MRSDYDVYAYGSEDWGARTAYQVECLRTMTAAEVTRAIGDQTLERKVSTTKRHGLDYKLLEIFVPVQWEGFEKPKTELGVYKRSI